MNLPANASKTIVRVLTRVDYRTARRWPAFSTMQDSCEPAHQTSTHNHVPATNQWHRTTILSAALSTQTCPQHS